MTRVSESSSASNECLCPPAASSSRRSSRSTTASNTEDDQYEVVRHVLPHSSTDPSNTNALDIKGASSPELLSSATSLMSSSSSSNDENDETPEQTPPSNDDTPKPVIQESGHFEPVEITAAQANLLAEATTTE